MGRLVTLFIKLLLMLVVVTFLIFVGVIKTAVLTTIKLFKSLIIRLFRRAVLGFIHLVSVLLLPFFYMSLKALKSVMDLVDNLLNKIKSIHNYIFNVYIVLYGDVS